MAEGVDAIAHVSRDPRLIGEVLGRIGHEPLAGSGGLRIWDLGLGIGAICSGGIGPWLLTPGSWLLPPGHFTHHYCHYQGRCRQSAKAVFHKRVLSILPKIRKMPRRTYRR